MAQQAVKRIQWSLLRRFQQPSDAQCIAILLDPRTFQYARQLIEQYDGDGHIVSATMPASTGYHVALAFSELIRVMDA